MSRIRSVHPEQWTDDNFVSCSPLARLLGIALRNEADDQGVFEWKPLVLKMRLLPADNCDVSELLKELIASRQVTQFTAGGKSYGAIRNFTRYQRPKKPVNRYPSPPSDENDYRTWGAAVGGELPTSTEPVGNQGGNSAADVGVGEGSIPIADAIGPAEPVGEPDLRSIVFDRGLRWFAQHTRKSEDQLRRWLGKCCGEFGDKAVASAIVTFDSRAPPVEPFSAFTSELQRITGNGRRHKTTRFEAALRAAERLDELQAGGDGADDARALLPARRGAGGG